MNEFVSENEKHSFSVKTIVENIFEVWKQIKELNLSDAFQYVNFGEILSKFVILFAKMMQQKKSKTIEMPAKRKKNKTKEINANLSHAQVVSKELCISINNISFLIFNVNQLDLQSKQAMEKTENNNPIIQDSWDQTLKDSIKLISQVLEEYLGHLIFSVFFFFFFFIFFFLFIFIFIFFFYLFFIFILFLFLFLFYFYFYFIFIYLYFFLYFNFIFFKLIFIFKTRELLPLFISSDLQKDVQLFNKTKGMIVLGNEIFKNVNLEDEEQTSNSNPELKQIYETLNETRSYFDERLSLISKYLSRIAFEKYLETIWNVFCKVIYLIFFF